MSHHSKFDDKLVDQFLGFLLVQDSIFQIPLNVNIQKRRGSSQRGSGTVIFLDSSQISQVQILHGLLRILCRSGDITTIGFCHLCHFF